MSKYDHWKAPEGCMLLMGWARDGLTDEQIAHNCGISRSTLSEWKRKYPAISDALKRGKEYADYQVENALYQAALAGNVTAMIFWLKNRRPDKWLDKPKQEILASGVGGVIILPPIMDDPEPPDTEDMEEVAAWPLNSSL